MAYKSNSELNGSSAKGGDPKKKLPGTATVPMDGLRELPTIPEKTPAAVIAPETIGAVTRAVGNTASRTGGGNSGAAGGSAAYSDSQAGRAPAEPLRFEAPERDQEAQQRYDEALGALQALQGKAPQYDSRYDEQIRSLYEQITGRAPFRYDSATDPLYQQYVQDYTTQGRMAMRDTMGRAAALTGGYGSSYAQSVGQQQYDAYLQRLADILPETYGMALDAYKAAGNELQQRFDTTAALEKSDYARYLDELEQYNLSLDRAQEDADRARREMLGDEDRAYARAEDNYERRAAQQQNAYTRLLKLIAAGYAPSEQELALAGLSSAQGAALVAAAGSATSRSGGSSGSGSSSARKKKTAAKGDLSKSSGSVKGR